MSFSGFHKGSSGKSSSKHSSHHDSKSSRSKSNSKTHTSGKNHPSSKANGQAGVSFLFVVNELHLNLHYPTSSDKWGNFTPPMDPNGFHGETVGRVFRYENGVVTHAESCAWVRPVHGQAGAIHGWAYTSDDAGNRVYEYGPFETFSTFTSFNCGPFLPCVFGLGDATVHDDEEFIGWHSLHFIHAGGASQASPNGGQRCVAGPHASFIDGLVPRVYTNTDPQAPRSRGLGGHMALIIGLMALSQAPGSIDHAFLTHAWHNNRWTGQRHPTAWPTAHEDPRGVLVHIALDPDGSSADEVFDFEWTEIAVEG